MVLGSIETLKYDPEMYLTWINGMIPFDILDDYQRKEVAFESQLAEIIDWRVNLVDLRRGIVTTIKEYFASEKKRGTVCFQREKSTCGRVTYERKMKRLT